MKTKFKIAKYVQDDGSFNKVGYDEYTITYLKGTKVHQLRIVVDGYLTNQKINLVSFKEGYKDKILRAICEYKEFGHTSKNQVKRHISLEFIKQTYSKHIVNNVQQYLININKEESRDKLTEYNLI